MFCRRFFQGVTSYEVGRGPIRRGGTSCILLCCDTGVTSVVFSGRGLSRRGGYECRRNVRDFLGRVRFPRVIVSGRRVDETGGMCLLQGCCPSVYGGFPSRTSAVLGPVCSGLHIGVFRPRGSRLRYRFSVIRPIDEAGHTCVVANNGACRTE